MLRQISQDEVIARRDTLPPFPRVIEDILLTLDDPDANIKLLVEHVGHDPVLAARVFSLANAAAYRTRPDSSVRDLYTATSLIGFKRLRQTAIMSSLAGFLRGALPPGFAPGFWEHSTATGISAQQLANQLQQSGDTALIAGLLHDIGQLWLVRIEAQAFSAAWQRAAQGDMSIETAERECFGVDHSIIGAWLVESWGLPASICNAVRFHHAPDSGPDEPLVPLIHVAEVLSNALDLSPQGSSRVSYLSAQSCEKLGLKWDDSMHALFGRIEAVSQFATRYFSPAESTP